MPRDIFGDVVDPSIKMGNKFGYTVCPDDAGEVGLVAAIVIVPLMAAGILPTPPSMMAFVAAPPPPPPPPPPRRRRRRPHRRPRSRSTRPPRRSRRPVEIKPETGHRGRVRGTRSAASTAVSPAASSVASPAASPSRRRRRRPRPPAGARRRQHQAAAEGQARQPGLSSDCAVGARSGYRDHRGHHRPQWRGEGCQGAAFDSACWTRQRSKP